MKNIIFLLIILIFNSCSNNNSEQYDSNTQYDSYLWHLFFTDNDFSTSYAIDENAHVNILNAWKISKGQGVKVAIIDESFEPAHEDIIDNVILTYNAEDESTNVTGSGTSHGNTCAGHVGALDNQIGIIGSAPEAQLILIKYGNSDAADIRAFDKALSEGAKVISCSWGSYDVSQALANKLQEVYSAGVTVIFAVGNDHISLDDVGIYDESELSSVLGIGASCENNDVCSYSNYGVNIDFIAPGGDHYSSIGLLGLDNSGEVGSSNQNELVTNNYAFGSGTSYSAPIVSGIIALMYSVNPDITPLRIRDILIESSQKVGDGVAYDNLGFDLERGYGKIDAYEAIKLAQQ